MSVILSFLNQLQPHMPVLSIMVLFMGAFLIAFLGERFETLRRVIVCFCVFVSLFCILWLIPSVMLQGEIVAYWLGGWEPVAGYAIGIGLTVDALSLFFALIVTVMAAASMLFSFRYISRDDSHEKYYTLFLMLCGGVLGLVLTGDLFNMYVMVEIMTFSAVALTAFRNWYHGALEASFKYLVVSCIGSTAILIGTALLYAGFHTLNLAQLAAMVDGSLSPVEILAFAFLVVGYGVKAFACPFHPIAADAHATAPSSVSVMISGVLTKTGVYGIIRVCFLLYKCMDRPAVRGLVMLFGISSMVVCVSMALVQHDFKRLLAFHSISQIGYVLTAVGCATTLGVAGGLYHALNHSLFKGLLFLCAGCVLFRTGTTDLEKLGGLSKRMPHTTLLFLIAAASISGLPPFNGFASKWTVYQALWEAAVTQRSILCIIALVAALLVSVMTLASFIKVSQAVFFGPLPLQYYTVREAPRSMRFPMGILAALCVVTGLFPGAVNRLLLTPAVKAVFSPASYIDAMMGTGYAAQASGGGVTDIPVTVTMPATWSPMRWLGVFALLCAGCFLGFAVLNRSRQSHGSAADKYATYFGGEAAEYTKVQGSDLFWGMRKNLAPYFNGLTRLHTGVVTDYALWAAAALAFVLVYAVLCFGIVR